MNSEVLGWVPSLFMPSTGPSQQFSKTLSNIKPYGDNFGAWGFTDSLIV